MLAELISMCSKSQLTFTSCMCPWASPTGECAYRNWGSNHSLGLLNGDDTQSTALWEITICCKGWSDFSPFQQLIFQRRRWTTICLTENIQKTASFLKIKQRVEPVILWTCWSSAPANAAACAPNENPIKWTVDRSNPSLSDMLPNKRESCRPTRRVLAAART